MSSLENRIDDRDRDWEALRNALLAELKTMRWVFGVAMTLLMLLLALIGAGVAACSRYEPERSAPPPVAAGQSHEPPSAVLNLAVKGVRERCFGG